jgi:hypothetical protein
MPNLEEAIRERAYHLWLADGCRDGAADAYWLSAQLEVLNASLSNSDTGTAAVPNAAVAEAEAPAKTKAAKAAAPKAASKAAAPKAKRRAA